MFSRTRACTVIGLALLAACASSSVNDGDVDAADEDAAIDAMNSDAPVSVDADCGEIPCDGIHVHPGGNDSNPGTRTQPMLTIGAAMVRADTAGKAVLVAAGKIG